MIRLASDRSLRKLSPARQTPNLSGLCRQIEQKVNQWIRTQPTASLVLAASVGAGLAWLIKRRT